METLKVLKDRPNSYECGKAGKRVKVYYNDIEDLKQQIKDLQEWGFIESDD